MIDLAEILAPLLEPIRAELAAVRQENERLRAEMVERLAALPGALLTEREACARLGVSRDTMAALRASGRIAYARIGSAIRYRREDLDAYTQAQRVQARPRRAVGAAQ